ncbi:hypothetical protein APS56_09060 [Pseudalgibacter alginicilyticus]|uniref:DUF1697 domain-containing protein n=1 Tax=Pseudalgibacter alginicilyticus TaxID=1736674 RepID=A0A0P0DB10_9FLAO|nr:DUF1697 domain-containing protein [Pseudalgibacter alginicilyticus]ALJ05260.1 hypothetical protein APS56_09060 [Pseudalgibacter alginicilyticus]
MNTYIAFLRGINVSGQKKIPMVKLRELLIKSGFKNVQTYIQSGNITFQSSEKNKNKLKDLIQNEIQVFFGFEVPVLLKTLKNIQDILNYSPFSEPEKETSYFTLLHAIPNKKLIESTSKENHPNETFYITKTCVYFYSPMSYGKAKCNNNFFERKLKVTATTRNYKTMTKLLSLCAEN